MEKIPSGSFSDAEVEEDDTGNNVPYDENEARSRNPVRRVNSSPEMSSNWRHPFNQKPNQNAQNNGSSNLTVRGTSDDDFIDIEQQQKKKNYGKVSCEAIPEEIADSTPPTQSKIEKRDFEKEKDKLIPVVASGTAKNQESDFVAKSNAANNTSVSLPVSRGSSSSDNLAPNTSLPRKQHSADDATQEQQNQQQPQQQQQQPPKIESSASSNAPKKLSIDMPKLTTKPPQSHAPLSPRLLARNNFDVSFQKNTNNFNDLPRGRSKTISVVRGEHDTSKWTFKGGEYLTNLLFNIRNFPFAYLSIN